MWNESYIVLQTITLCWFVNLRTPMRMVNGKTDCQGKIIEPNPFSMGSIAFVWMLKIDEKSHINLPESIGTFNWKRNPPLMWWKTATVNFMTIWFIYYFTSMQSEVFFTIILNGKAKKGEHSNQLNAELISFKRFKSHLTWIYYNSSSSGSSITYLFSCMRYNRKGLIQSFEPKWMRTMKLILPFNTSFPSSMLPQSSFFVHPLLSTVCSSIRTTFRYWMKRCAFISRNKSEWKTWIAHDSLFTFYSLLLLCYSFCICICVWRKTKRVFY